MKTVPVASAGPIDDVRHADAHARAALADAVVRSARLWRSIADPAAPVPGLDRAAIQVPDGSPAQARTAVNDRHLTDISERDMRQLADMLEETAARYLAVAACATSR